MLLDPRYDRALGFAKAAHGDQKRKYTGEPYWTHLVRVAEMVSKTPHATMEMVEAALLHDVIEDTPIYEKEVFDHFGPVVAHYVSLLTDPAKTLGNRAARKAMTVDRLMGAPNEVKTIKLADLLDNGPSIVAYDPKFARVFLREKSILLLALNGGDEALFRKAVDFLYDCRHLQSG